MTLSALAALASLTLVGCSAHSGLPPSPTATRAAKASPEVLTHAALSARHEAGGGDAARVDRALKEMETAFATGQAALLAGDEDAAFDAFDDAVASVLRSDVDLDAHPDVRERADQVIAAINEIAVSIAVAEEPTAPGVPRIADIDGVAIARASCANLTIPLVSHPAVDAMVRFYTGRAKERLELGLSRYGKYAPTIQRILAEEGVPQELAWLALVESNFNAQAISSARAKGLWQFMPATGRQYNLDQNFWVDERTDFEKATRSAAQYLRFLHGMFGDWHLALASYNAGEGKVGRAIKATGRKDFWRIRETRYLRRETKDYVPAFLAVVSIMQDPAAHGVTFAPAPALQWETAPISSVTDLSVIASCAGTSLEVLQDLNPELRRGTTPASTGAAYPLRLPIGSRAQFEARYAALPPEQRLSWHQHVVQRGDSVSAIAMRYGTSTGAVLAANRLSATTALAPGRTLLIPAGPSVDAVPEAVLASRAPRVADEPEPTSTRRTSYRVRPGDTLGKIASRHGTSIAKLAEWNGLRNRNRIHVGQRLTIHGSSSGSSSVSSSSASSSRRSASSRVTHHVVRRGDTLSAIARQHGLSVSQLRRLNGLGSSNIIRPGQRLRVTSSGSAAFEAPGLPSATTRSAANMTGGPAAAS